MKAIDIYQSRIKPLPVHERLLLKEWMAHDFAREISRRKARANNFKLRGLGKDVWTDIDVNEYIH